MMIRDFRDKKPSIHPSVRAAEDAVVLGDVTLERDVTLWYHCTLRGDVDAIAVGAGSNIQDGCVVHCGVGHPTRIGRDVVVGHNAIVHGCTIEDGCLIGMGAIILDKAVIGDNSIVGAGALVTKNTVVPAGSLVLGSPAKVVKQLDEKAKEGLGYWSKKYAKLAAANKAKEEASAGKDK